MRFHVLFVNENITLKIDDKKETLKKENFCFNLFAKNFFFFDAVNKQLGSLL